MGSQAVSRRQRRRRGAKWARRRLRCSVPAMRASFASLITAALLTGALAPSTGCGGKGGSSNTIPESQLEPAAEPVTPAPAATPTPTPAPAPPAAPPPPLQVSIEPSAATIKLLSAGKGTRAKLRLSLAASAKQQVELLMDAVIEQAPTGQPAQKVIMPTVVLAGTGEVTAVGGDGAATYRTVIDSVDVRDRPNQTLPAADVKSRLGTLIGMKIDGTVAAAGAAGATTYLIEKPEADTAGAIESLKMMLPTWVPLPEEAIGVGARWTVTLPVLWNGIATSQTTTYKLVSRTATAAVISGEIKITGADQKLQDVAVSNITGSGQVEATLEAGKLYPKLKRTSSTSVRLMQGTDGVVITMQVGSAFEPK